jgi:tRNASer (uridine44-2'-O)-methyltransferase
VCVNSASFLWHAKSLNFPLIWPTVSFEGLIARGLSFYFPFLSSLPLSLPLLLSPCTLQNWPEATDPHKFVYEDIAIATYLILLWEKEREECGLTKKQTFIDLGCGNGLLVYLITSEGYTGKGIDLRRRKIWGYYGDRADLEVVSLTPSDLTVFPQFDWLIGNHSDELTPWIPLMAARSSYQTHYFVLPCCPHDFDSKFRRPDTTKSQYSSYLDYIRLIGETVGFRVQEDTLRIPSSKRVSQRQGSLVISGTP